MFLNIENILQDTYVSHDAIELHKKNNSNIENIISELYSVKKLLCMIVVCYTFFFCFRYND